jgi:hypothetical protein
VSHWGTLDDIAGARHVVPCTSDGTVLAPHSASVACSCIPRKDYDSKGVLYVHDDPARGGSEHGDTN